MSAFIVFLILLLNTSESISKRQSQSKCEFNDDLNPAIATILCAVEQEVWYINKNSSALLRVGCLLGGKNRCETTRVVPLREDVPISKAPPAAKNKQYQALAMKAEELVPATWWRQGFDNAHLLLSKDEIDLPRKQFDTSLHLNNKKLKNLHQCVTRQQFIRRSFSFEESRNDAATSEEPSSSKCTAMKETVVKRFYDMWAKGGALFGGEMKVGSSGNKFWAPSEIDDGKLLVAALEVLEHFYSNYGGVWTGCFKLEKSASCRGALSAAALVSSAHILYDIAAKHKDLTESAFIAGYLLASLGRGLLHGDSSSTGNKPSTQWNLRLIDFIALQQAFFKLYIDSYGSIYTQQLNKHLPIAFAPSFKVKSKQEWRHLAESVGSGGSFEPIYTSLRNWMFHESSNLIDFGPYRPLISFQEVRQMIKHRPGGRRVLIDVGANGFFASPKYLLDSYIPYMPFTHLIMIEPEPHFSATVPKSYFEKYNITFLQIYAEVNTGSATDIIKLLPTLVTKQDFVVLKFDVDPNRYAQGPTMEWGFLFDLMHNEATAMLVDETYIELHFSFPKLFWYHYHSNWEALDALRYLRSKGCVIHAWP